MAEPTDPVDLPPTGPADPPGSDPQGSDPPGDAGLQPERTRLAWRRSALALTLVVLLTVRLAIDRGGPALLAAPAAVVGWAALIGYAYRRARGPRRPAAGQIGAEVPLLGLVTAGYALLGAVLILR